MAECHVARCDGPSCQKEENLKVSVSSQSWHGTGVSYPMTSYALPDGWRQLEMATLCSWKCLGEYAATRSEQAQQ